MPIDTQFAPNSLLEPEIRLIDSNGANNNRADDLIEPRSEHGKVVSEEEYWLHYYEHPDISYEWNNGVLEEKPLPDYRRITMYGWFLVLLRAYLEVNPIAKLIFLETGFRLPMGKKTSIRKPDLFVIRNDNPTPLLDNDRSFHGIADLCVESLSNSTRAEVERDTIVKKGEYALVGVKEYYILDPDDEMAFYRRTAAGRYAKIKPDDDDVIHSEVLPGFCFRIADLYDMPSLEMMAHDPIYQPFVLVKYQEEIARAEEARASAEEAWALAAASEERAEEAWALAAASKERASAAEQKAEQERLRAERMAARLRELGVDVD